MVGAASTGGVNRNSLMRRGLAARFAQTVGFGWPRLARDSTSTQAESATESHARVALPAEDDARRSTRRVAFPIRGDKETRRLVTGVEGLPYPPDASRTSRRLGGDGGTYE